MKRPRGVAAWSWLLVGAGKKEDLTEGDSEGKKTNTTPKTQEHGRGVPHKIGANKAR